MTLTGPPADINTALTLYAGWNWIPYLPQAAGAIASAMPSHTYAANDLVKSQSQFSTYYANYGWFGSLITLTPGIGYMLKVASAGTVSYSSFSANGN